MNENTWIKAKLDENGLDKVKVQNLYSQFREETGSTATLASFKRRVRENYEEICLLTHTPLDEPISNDSLVSLASSKQSLQDTNTYLRKVSRENFRVFNSLESVYTEYVEALQKYDLSHYKITPQKTDKNSRVGICQLSDLHFNKLVNEYESESNSYDFSIASQRLKKYTNECKLIFKAYNVKDVYLFMTGDLISSSRRVSEKLVQATSLSRASLLATSLIQQMILDLAKDFNTHVSAVVGNESRLSEHFETVDIMASENWDYLIFQNLRLLFSKEKAIEFIEPKNYIKSLVTLKNGFNALLLHGHSLKGNLSNNEISKIASSYILDGKKINGIFCGHIHSSSIGDILSRSSSMIGSDSYAFNDLNCNSRASQNCYIINDDLSYNGLKIDLQNVKNIVGYTLNSDLERYLVRGTAPTQSILSKNLV